MAGFCGATQAVLDGSLQLGRPTRLFGATGSSRVAGNQSVFVPIRAQRAPEESEEAATQSSRRAMLRLVTAGVAGGSFVKSALAAAKPIKVGPPPPTSGGLPGTKNSDVPRDVFLPLKERFFIQPLSPVEAVQRVKDSAKEIVGVKSFIEKKAWPYVSNDLRLKSSYLRYDLNTVISSKSKEEKQSLKELTGKLFATIDDLDHAAKTKSPSEAEKYYALTVTQLNDVIAKLG